MLWVIITTGQVIRAGQLLRQRNHLLGRVGVQRRRMLIQQQQLRFGQCRHHQRDRLPLAAAEQRDIGVEPVLQAQMLLLQLLEKPRFMRLS